MIVKLKIVLYTTSNLLFSVIHMPSTMLKLEVYLTVAHGSTSRGSHSFLSAWMLLLLF